MSKTRYRLLRLAPADLHQLRNYSLSNPTPLGGLRDHGRRWKRNLRFGQLAPPQWIVCEYVVQVSLNPYGDAGEPQMHLTTRLYCPVLV